MMVVATGVQIGIHLADIQLLATLALARLSLAAAYCNVIVRGSLER